MHKYFVKIKYVYYSMGERDKAYLSDIVSFDAPITSANQVYQKLKEHFKIKDFDLLIFSKVD